MRLRIERDAHGSRALVLRRGREAPEAAGRRLERETPEPLEGTLMSLYNSIIPAWWSENMGATGSYYPGDASLAERVWVANRCIQLNAQQIAHMPVQFHGPPSESAPAWVSSPDPHWYPNGVGDALHFVVEQIYGWGYACLYVTDWYSDGLPRTWTVLDNAALNIRREAGERRYRLGDDELNPGRIIQIDRNPGARVHGTSALRAYAQLASGLLAAGNQAMAVQDGGTPKFYLKTTRKLNKAQAADLQAQWMNAASARAGAPPVIPPEVEPTEMSFDPSDLALLETQEFDAKAIMTAFGVPAPLMNMALTGGLTYQNPATLGEMWWRFELRQTATRIANALTAQALPAGQWITLDAADTFVPLDEASEEDDPQASQVAKASPADQKPRLSAIGGAQV